ncbi:MAG: EamA family transporter [Candidatus Micrarchaeota archaeon]|nr:EamA family transporter [Candidatus Micrarchaeota archaeon]
MIEWYYLVVASSILLGVGAIVEKNTLKVEHATQFSAAFSWIILAISIVFLLPYTNFAITPFNLLLMFVAGLFGSASYLISARVFKHGNLSAISPVSTSLPIFFLVVLAFFILNEKLSVLEYVSIVGIIIATYLIIFRTSGGKKHLQQFDSNKYKYFLIVNSLGTGVSMLITKYLLVNNNPFAFLIVLEFFMAINFTVYISRKYNGVKEIVSTIYQYKFPIIAVALLTLGYRITYYLAISDPSVPVSVAFPLRNALYVIITVLAGGELFKEQGLKQKLLLSIIMAIFGFILAVSAGAIG